MARNVFQRNLTGYWSLILEQRMPASSPWSSSGSANPALNEGLPKSMSLARKKEVAGLDDVDDELEGESFLPPRPNSRRASAKNTMLLDKTLFDSQTSLSLSLLLSSSSYNTTTLLSAKPKSPGSEDCCMSGCAICVWDIYQEEMETFRAEKEESKKIRISLALKRFLASTAKRKFFEVVSLPLPGEATTSTNMTASSSSGPKAEMIEIVDVKGLLHQFGGQAGGGAGNGINDEAKEEEEEEIDLDPSMKAFRDLEKSLRERKG